MLYSEADELGAHFFCLILQEIDVLAKHMAKIHQTANSSLTCVLDYISNYIVHFGNLTLFSKPIIFSLRKIT
jgi:hypothetical protein